MADPENNDTPLCPQDKQPCVGEQCMGFNEVELPMSSAIAGFTRTGELKGCYYQVVPFLLGALLQRGSRPGPAPVPQGKVVRPPGGGPPFIGH